MRRKVIALFSIVLMIFGLLPVTALADPVYNAHDVAQIKAFLEQPSAEAGKTNAEQLGYDVNDPSTWLNVAWIDDRVQWIEWIGCSLSGTLDLSGFDEITLVSIADNALTSLDVSNANKVERVYCNNNSITSLNLSGSAALQEIKCYDNALTTLDLSGLSMLTLLKCQNNKLTALDLKDSPVLQTLDCSSNMLSALDLSAQTSLACINCANNKISSLSPKSEVVIDWLYCENNSLTSLDLTAVTSIFRLNCKNNALTALDLSKFNQLVELDASGNKLASLKAMIENKSIVLAADGDGYVGLAYKITILQPKSVGDEMSPTKFDPQIGYLYAEAVPAAPSTFVRWMTADANEVSKNAKVDLTPGESYTLTAKFLPQLKLESSVTDGKIYTSGRITLTPNIPGGTWTWDQTYFTATFNGAATFTGLKSGTSRVTYTVEGISTYYDITVSVSRLPATGQDDTWVYILSIAALIVAAAAVGLAPKKKSI